MTAETPNSLPALLETLGRYLNSACDSAPEALFILPPKDGISLFDVKNELFLSYLQNLVFLILLKLRNRSNSTISEDGEANLDNIIVKKLVELRVYLERGVRRLEGDLSYQINKVLQAAEDAARISSAAQSDLVKKTSGAGSGNEEDSEDQEDSEAESTNGGVEINDLQYRPNPSAFTRPSNTAEDVTSKPKDGIYKPPRITATSMPMTTTGGPRTKDSRTPKSATLDEFISTEYSTAPTAQPSIGSGIVGRGRRTVSEREKREEKEKRDYEESNFVRLPQETKKEKAEKKKRFGGRERMGYGGEEWRGLGEGVDRIERLTKRKREGGSSGVLERSRKRKAEEGSRSGALGIGQGFEKRLKTLDRKRGDRRK